jgi:hypothetical protein
MEGVKGRGCSTSGKREIKVVGDEGRRGRELGSEARECEWSARDFGGGCSADKTSGQEDITTLLEHNTTSHPHTHCTAPYSTQLT